MTGARIASARGSHESLRARTSSVTARSTVRPAPRITEPWRFAQTTSSGRTRSVRRRTPRRDASTRSHRTPAKSGSAVVCARIVQPHGPARIASRPTRKVERDEAPPVRAVGGGEREREEDEEDAEQDHRAHPGERVRAVEDDLREPLLVGPRLAPAEDRDRLRVREAVLDDLAARHQRQPRVADDDRGGEDREEHDPDERDEQDREGARLERAAEGAGCGDWPGDWPRRGLSPVSL